MIDIPPSAPDDLSGLFDDKRQKPSSETLEKVRHNYFIAAKISGSDDESIGGLNIPMTGRHDDAGNPSSKKNRLSDDLLFIDMLEIRYGTDFAENWAAQLLDEEIYKALMLIEDQDERREAIAEAILEGIKNGTIDRDKLDNNPDLQEWLHRYASRSHRTVANTAVATATDHALTESNSEEAALDDIFSSTPGLITPS